MSYGVAVRRTGRGCSEADWPERFRREATAEGEREGAGRAAAVGGEGEGAGRERNFLDGEWELTAG